MSTGDVKEVHVSGTGPTGRRLFRRTSAVIAIAVGIGCPAGALATGLGLFHWYGQGRLYDVAQVGFLTAVIVAAHALTTAWAWSTKASRRDAVVTQLPYLLTYVLALVWNFGYRFAPGYVGWAAAVLVAASWLTVWYLRDFRRARRAVAYLVGIALLVVVNGGAALLVGWRQTNGYGLIGQRTPWNAVQALAATSCLAKGDFYTSGNRTVEAHCPSGPDADLYAGTYDEGSFNKQLCGDQPRAAFQVWWERVRRYQVWVTLDFGFSPQWQIVVDGKPAALPRPLEQPGNTATITLTMRVTAAFRPGDLPPEQKHPMRLDKDNETWHITANRTVLGGWKVCTIDVADPIQASAA
jgi:hypothetical protein